MVEILLSPTLTFVLDFLIFLLTLAPHSGVLADGGAPAVLALAHLSVLLANGCAPSVLALAPHSVVLEDGGAPAVLALAPLSVVLADGGAPAVLALAPHSVIESVPCCSCPFSHPSCLLSPSELFRMKSHARIWMVCQVFVTAGLWRFSASRI